METNQYPGFKSKKKIEKGTKGYGLKQLAKMTLGTGNLEMAVELPDGEDLNEWLAVNTIEFYNDSKHLKYLPFSKSFIWNVNRILHKFLLSGNVSWSKIRILMGRWSKCSNSS